MNRKELIKLLKESLSFGLVSLGIFNILLLVRYFKQGMDRSLIPPNITLFLLDAAIFVTATVIIMTVELVISKLRKNKSSNET